MVTTGSFESRFIEDIIEDILKKLNLAYFPDTPYSVGIESRVEELSKCLDWYSDDVCMIGIWGMGGIGKTTMAQAIYDLLKGKFEGSCFLGNVRERAQQSNGLIDLQEQILSSVGVNSNKRIRHVDEGTTAIIDNIQGKMVLFVLDDVDHLEQLHIVAIIFLVWLWWIWCINYQH